MEIAGRFQAAGPDVLVIDTETDFVKLGIAKQLAAVMGGNYYKLQQLSQQKILQIIRSVRA
jgi:magnesium chelatase subunit D